MCPSRGLVLLLALVICNMNKPGECKFPENSTGWPWFANGCSKVHSLLRKKSLVAKHVYKKRKELEGSRLESATTKLEQEILNLKLELYWLFIKEINQSEQFLVAALESFREILNENVNEADKLRQKIVDRVKQLQHAIFLEEAELKDFSRIQTDLEKLQSSSEALNNTDWTWKKIFVEMVSDLHVIVAEIENNENEAKSSANSEDHSDKKENEIEAVYQLRGNQGEMREGEDRPAEVLVDVRNNKYILSMPEDSTLSLEDRTLIVDMFIVIITAYVLSCVLSFISVPSVVGFIAAGVLVGPAGMNLVTDVVQIATLGEVGVFVTVLDIGIHCGQQNKLWHLWKIILFPFPALVLLLFLLLIFFTSVLASKNLEILTLSMCVAISTKHILPNKLTTGNYSPNAGEAEFMKLFFVGQHIYLAIVLAVLPTLRNNHDQIVLNILATLVKSALMCVFVSVLVYAASKVQLDILRRLMQVSDDEYSTKQVASDQSAMFILLLLFVVVVVSHVAHVSAELSCICLGAALMHHPIGLSSWNEENVGVVKSVFSSLFYASVGFHLIPSLLVTQMTLVVTFTVVLLSLKLFVLSLLLRPLVPPHVSLHAVLWRLACNVGELALIVGSRARMSSLLSKEIYLLVVSVSALSLTVNPFIHSLLTRMHPISHPSKHLPPF